MYSIGWSLIKIWAGLEDSERIPRILKEFLEGSESIMRGFSFIQEMCDNMLIFCKIFDRYFLMVSFLHYAHKII